MERTFLQSVSGILAVALVATACGGDQRSDASPGPSVSYIVPSVSITDWVSYAKQLSVVTVVREEPGPVPPAVAERGEGHIPSALTLRIEKTLWTAPGMAERSGEIQTLGWGSFMHDGKLHPLQPELKAGATYLVPFAAFETGLGPMRPASIRVVDGRVGAIDEATRADSGEWVAELGGLTLEEVAALFAAAQPDALAMKYADLNAEAQVAAVRRERTPDRP